MRQQTKERLLVAIDELPAVGLKNIADYLATCGGYGITLLLYVQSIAQLKELGIDVEIQSVEETQFSNRMLGGDFDALVTQFWNGADPDANYHFWTGDNIGSEGSITLNFPRWSNDEVDAALNKAREAGTEQERKDAYATVWQQWAEHVPYLWIYHAKWLILYRDRVHGLSDLRTPEGAEIEPVQWGSVFLTATWVTGG